MKAMSKAATQQRGFTTSQMVITLAIIAIVSTFGVLGIKSARAQFQLQNAARLFASYVEKARADSIRRHAATGQESSIEMFGIGTTSYAVTMDFGNGIETRTFQLDPGLTFGTAAAKVTFDWRGRLLGEAVVFQIQSDYLGERVPVDVSGSGDITVGEQHFPDQLIPPVEISEVTGDVDTSNPDPTPTPMPTATPAVDASPTPEPDPNATPTPTPTPTPNGNGNGNGNGNDGNNGNGNGNPTPTPTPTPTPSQNPTPTPTPIPQCVSTVSPSTLSLSQSDPTKQSGSAIFTMTNATGVRIISASLVGNGNSLNLGLSLQRIDGNGSSVITVTTKNGAGNRGVFEVQINTDPACGTAPKLTVSVSN